MKGITASALCFTLCLGGCTSPSSFYIADHQGIIVGPYQGQPGETIAPGTVVHPSTDQIHFSRRLQQTIIPRINAHDASLADIVEFLRVESQIYTPEELKNVAVRFDISACPKPDPNAKPADPNAPTTIDSLLADPQPTTRITFEARNIALIEAIRVIADAMQLTVSVHSQVVHLFPEGTAAPRVESPFED